MTEKSTKERIISAAIELVNELGYLGATTRRIAEKAGVNEVTIFRHFGNKKGLVQAAIDSFAIPERVLDEIDQFMTWDLEHDLPLLVKHYHEVIEQKREVILLGLKEAGTFPELDELIAHIPTMYTEKVTSYFEKMIDKGNLRESDPTTLATSFIYMNFGYFLLKNRVDAKRGTIDLDEFITNNVALFIRSIQ